MNTSDQRFSPFAAKMRDEDLPTIAISNFQYYYEQLAGGATGMYPESDIAPVLSLPDADSLTEETAQVGAQAMRHAVMLKLNGGLGTGMGLEKAKSLLMVKKGLTFLDIIARQSIQADFPILLMNSFATREDSLDILARYPEVNRGLPLDFLQNKVPKIDQATLEPVCWPNDPDLEWCPPGHGDIYTALTSSGMLQQLLDNGFRYAFVSNSDNLGALLDEHILGYFVQGQLPFMMEVADRTEADRKGGHLALLGSDQHRFILRESAQCPAEDMDAFQDTAKHKYFNTNNLWIDLVALDCLLKETGGVVTLPLIRNAKTVDPKDATSTPVYQLETAMGAAIAVFEGATAIRVPRTRFAPVKTCDDLLAVRSDATVLTEEYSIVSNPARVLANPVIKLDSRFYKLVADLEKRFPAGPPSLLNCEKLTVKGDVLFEGDVTLTGAVEIVNESAEQAVVRAGSRISGLLTF